MTPAQTIILIKKTKIILEKEIEIFQQENPELSSKGKTGFNQEIIYYPHMAGFKNIVEDLERDMALLAGEIINKNSEEIDL